MERPSAPDSALDVTLAYHERTKHHPFRFAASLGYMDWATQPDPFRRFTGARVIPLGLTSPDRSPRYEPAFLVGHAAPAPLNHATISQLFQDSLALSAWKQVGNVRWALRVNPSSGNLHPTEGYLVAGPIEDVNSTAGVYHYAPLTHALEVRAGISNRTWEAISTQLPMNSVLFGLTSIHWRESWKYGERAFRYCHHDAGHAIACVAIAAAGLGWEARLLEATPDAELSELLGVQTQSGIEAEHADCIMVVSPAAEQGRSTQRTFAIGPSARDELRSLEWSGIPNLLSRDHHEWPAIDEVAEATVKRDQPPETLWSWNASENSSLEVGNSPLALRRIICQRRSAVELDGRTGITRDAFYQILLKATPGARQAPFTTLPWSPCVDLLLFVHRVADVKSGLYALVRHPGRQPALAAAMDSSFAWSRPTACPASLPLYFLDEGDARHSAQQTSCNQAIAADGVFACAMLAEYRASLEEFGPWFYRRLHWEAGAIGQVLYLEAEASGIRGTGIGCFFDDATHRIFGLTGDRFQVLYHFTMGGPIEDARLRTDPPYGDR